jgi:hypothetical protein
MEHLRRPKKPANPPVKVPYLCLEEYDRLGFSDYPVRQGFHKGWLISEFRHLESQQRVYDKAKIKSLVQSWLFFGMLIEVLEVSGTRVKQEDFIREEGSERFLTTKKLTEYVEEWIKQGSKFSQDVEKRHIEKADECLREASKYIRNLAWDGEWSMGFLVQEMAVAILGLFGTLRDARDRRVSQSPSSLMNNPLLGVQNVGISQITYDRLSKNGWCPSQIAKLLAYIAYEDVLFYLGDMVRPDARTDHSSCSKIECLANQVDRISYKTRHTRDDCKCDEIEADANEMARILLAGDYPLINILEQPGDAVQLQVIERRSCTEYVAISHVWGHGLGNVKKNALPRCQLLHLRKLASDLWEFHWNGEKHGSLNSLKKKSIPIWMDTLCVPVDGQLKKVALRRMRETFQNARDVLVLDRELQHSEYGDFFEANFRICCSDWSRRLWTYQEGGVAQNVIVQFKDEPVHYTRDFVIQIACHFEDSPFVGSALSLGDLEVHFDRHNYAASILRIETFGMFDLIDKSQQPGKPYLLTHLMNMASALQHRSTSSQEDEAGCIASLLHLDVEAVLREPPKRRMIKVFELLGTVPAPLLFMKGTKIGDFPFQWAPSSLLGRSDDIITQRTLDRSGNFHITDYSGRPELEAQVTQRGLFIKRPGFFVLNIGRKFGPASEIRIKTTEGSKLPGVDDAGPKPTPTAKRMYKINISDPKTQETLRHGIHDFIVVVQDIRGAESAGPTWNGVLMTRASYSDREPFSIFSPRAFGGDGRSLGPESALYGHYSGWVQVKAGWSTDADHADLEIGGLTIPRGLPEGIACMGFDGEQEWYIG